MRNAEFAHQRHCHPRVSESGYFARRAGWRPATRSGMKDEEAKLPAFASVGTRRTTVPRNMMMGTSAPGFAKLEVDDKVHHLRGCKSFVWEAAGLPEESGRTANGLRGFETMPVIEIALVDCRRVLLLSSQ